MTTQMYCLNCGTVGFPETRVRGSFVVEIVLWLFMILPGVFYTIWRLTTKEAVCPACGVPNMIPTTSPKAVAAGAMDLTVDTEKLSSPPFTDEEYAAHAKRGLVLIVVLVLVMGMLAFLWVV